jgi:uncharacterized protein YdaL
MHCTSRLATRRWSIASLSWALGTLAVACDPGHTHVANNEMHSRPLEVHPFATAESSIGVARLPTIPNRAPDRSSVEGWPEPPTVAPAEGMPVLPSPIMGDTSALILYDTEGEYGWLGELYAVSVANLASHFGSWRAVPASAYTCGEMADYTATIYLGSSYDAALPQCLLADVLASTRPVMWVDFNIWQLETCAGASDFSAQYGFTAMDMDMSQFSSVSYHGRSLGRYVENPGILDIEIVDPSRVTELATAVRPDGTTAPWAVRSGNLTVVSEIPFSWVDEEDRLLAFEDMLFDLLQPDAPERHRAMLRLEDIDPNNDPAQLHAIADYLSSMGVPFGFGVIARHRDPLGYYHGGVPELVGFEDVPALVEALHYMEAHGGTMVMHGWTHQWDGGENPYNEVSGDDTEFFRIVQNPDETFDYVGPLPEDSIEWATGRIHSAADDFRAAGFRVPTIFEFPHYAASTNSYLAVAGVMASRWERGNYYSGVLTGGEIDHSRTEGQMFPFVVRDVYGTIVYPENLGNIDLTVWHGLPARSPEDIIRAADRNLVVRDGVACFFFHPFLPIEYMEQTVEGIRSLGYTFVSPSAL